MFDVSLADLQKVRRISDRGGEKMSCSSFGIMQLCFVPRHGVE